MNQKKFAQASENTALPVECRFKDGFLSVSAKEYALFSMKKLTGCIRLDGREYFMHEARKAGRFSKDSAADFQEEYELPDGIFWSVTLHRDGLSWLWETRIRNNGKKAVKVNEFALYGCRESGFSVQTGRSPERIRVFQWNPWSMDIADLTGCSRKYYSCTLLHLSESRSGFTMLPAFATFDRMPVSAEIMTGKKAGEIVRFRMTCSCDSFLLKPGKTLAAETIRFSAFSNPYAALNSWADDAQKRYQPDFTGTAGVCVTGGVWHDTFTSKKLNAYTRILKTMDAAEKKLAGFGLDLMSAPSHAIFKDGLPGNWMDFESCPQGDYGKLLAGLSSRRHWKFKSWLSPFWFFGEAENCFRANKDNLVRDTDGKAVCRLFTGSWEFARRGFRDKVLHQYFPDGTDPRTHAYLAKVLRFNRKMGIRAYMLDFLTSVPGAKLHDDSMLPVEISRSIFKTIRRICGKDTHIQTAVASSPAYIGCVNSARVVRDFGEGRPQNPFPNWRNANYCMHDLHFSNAFSFLQNAAASWFTNRKIYVNDLNEMTIDHPVPLEFARMSVTLFGLSGDSPVCLGDDLANIHPERLRMLKMILPRTAGIPVPVDLFDRTTEQGGCHILKKEIRTKYDRYLLAAVFHPDPECAGVHAAGDLYGGREKLNWKRDRNDLDVTLDFSRLGLDVKKKYCVYEFWDQEYCGIYRKAFRCRLQPGSCRLYRIAEYREHPWLISTDLHVEQGNAEITGLVYDPEKLTLTIRAKRPVGESGRATVLMPRNFRLVNHEEINTMKEVIDMQTVCGVPLVFDRETIRVKLQFELLETDSLAHQNWLPYETEQKWLRFVKKHPFRDPNRVIE